MSDNEKEREAETQNQVFICYSHKDAKWLKQLKDTLEPVIEDDVFRLWDDTQITPGDNWRKEIEDALSQAKAAILLVSSDFLRSDFIKKKELPRLLDKEKSGGLKILWIALRPCIYTGTPIANYQALNDPEKPLKLFNTATGAREKELVRICKQIRKIVKSSKETRKHPNTTPAKIKSKNKKEKRISKNDSRESFTFTAGKIKSRSCKILENKLLKNQKSRETIKGLFFTLKNEICEIDKNIEEKISKRMVTFISKGRGMVWFSPLVTKLKIHLRKGEYTDKYNKIKEGWGEYPLLSVSSDDMDLDYLKDLFTQSYNM